MADWTPAPYVFDCPVCGHTILAPALIIPATSQLVIDVDEVKKHFKYHTDEVMKVWGVLQYLNTNYGGPFEPLMEPLR